MIGADVDFARGQTGRRSAAYSGELLVGRGDVPLGKGDEMSRLSLGSLSWVLVILAAAVTAAWLPASSAGDPFPLPFPFPGTFLGALGAPAEVASTVPATGAAAGDQNPYGVAVVPGPGGGLAPGEGGVRD